MAPTIILRHRKENLKKCSLTPLQNREDLLFYRYPKDLTHLPTSSGLIALVVGAEPFQPERYDSELPFLLIDGTWRLAEVMWREVQRVYPGTIHQVSLPSCKTAYPRRQTGCAEPEEGLASVEALYLLHRLIGRSVEGLLDQYYWKDEFLLRNAALWDQIESQHRIAECGK
jgi:pre-rRNA-processing protein TSR3